MPPTSSQSSAALAALAKQRLAAQRMLPELQRAFIEQHPLSMAAGRRSAAHLLWGVPMHWMCDWPSPTPLVIERAQGVTVRCADGFDYADFCLGDTGAMFGHSPSVLVQALGQALPNGLTTMLPSQQSESVGAMLHKLLGLDVWQFALSASDANRFMLKWARAVTKRPVVLVFDGCYHGAVDETLVDASTGNNGTNDTVARASVLGQVHDHASWTRIVPFNDLPALEAALMAGDVACLLAEPALTNCGMVLPDEGFWQQAAALCKRAGTLLVLDETHTMSSGLGGYAHQCGLRPDALVVGKALAGGIPCAAYGVTKNMALRMQAVKDQAPHGHSGIGTTLSANPFTMAALAASLTHLHTASNYQHMLATASLLANGLQAVIAKHGVRWSVSQLGARIELQWCATPPRNAQNVRNIDGDVLDAALHLHMLNHGVLLTPFHGMMLCAPATDAQHVDKLLVQFDAWTTALLAH